MDKKQKKLTCLNTFKKSRASSTKEVIIIAGYKHPCRYCNEFIEPESNTCPHCSKVNPLRSLRCPRCKHPVRKSWSRCSDCNLELVVTCPHCRQESFFGDYCDHCDERLMVICKAPDCGEQQPPLEDNCIKCKQPLT